MAIRWAGARWRQLFQEPTLCVSYINGMLTSERDALEHTQHISAAFAGRTVHAFWNPTAGAYADLVKTANLKLRGADYPEVDGLTRHLRECVASLHDGSSRPGRVLHLAHSQGALITHLAAKQLTCAEKRQIEVVTFGAAQSIDASDGFRRSVNYFAMNDPVLYLDQSAARAWSGLDKAAIDRVMASGTLSSGIRRQCTRGNWRSFYSRPRPSASGPSAYTSKQPWTLSTDVSACRSQNDRGLWMVVAATLQATLNCSANGLGRCDCRPAMVSSHVASRQPLSSANL